MKKVLAAVLSLTMLGAAALPALADGEEPSVAASSTPALIAAAPEEEPSVSGFAVQVDGEPVPVRACVMVPLRAVAERLGFTVAWDNGAVTVTGPERYARLTVGEDQYFAAPVQEGMLGASLFSLGCAPYVSNGSTYVPVELFSAVLGCREGTVTLEENTVRIAADTASENTVQLPSPFTDRATLAEAAEAAGFPLAVPAYVNDSPRRDIQTIDGEMIQVFYGDGDGRVCIRKAPGSADISGDYSAYAQTETLEVNGTSVTLKGEDGLAYLAIWTWGGYTYSIHARSGMDSAAMTALVRSVG